MKSCYEISVPRRETVAPLAGAWIEIVLTKIARSPLPVAPLAGAWIEILYVTGRCSRGPMSLPSRERGLK